MSKNKTVPFQQINIKHGFWHEYQQLNSEKTIFNLYKRFKETGRFDSWQFDWQEGKPNKPHIFWDSDVAKWIESAAFILEKKSDPRLEEIVDELVELLEKNQDATGYFNCYFTVCEPDKRFVHRTEHELYCAGHLFEAAVAYACSTGKEKFLHLMCKYADYIEEVFKNNHSTNFYTPGHEEIELALVKLYRYTGERRYLELSKWFVDQRGMHNEDIYNWVTPYYCQDHLPVREMETAEGHSVRALYLYCSMADLSYEYDDKPMLEACRRIFKNIAERRMYISGGIGSSSLGDEAFTSDYDLPNLTAYSESCAAIGLILFAQRMLLLEQDSRYADVAERTLYNGFLSSISLDGKKFFYVNPLEIVPELLKSNRSIKNNPTKWAPTQRVEVFNCSCCPPNITRLIASLGNILYTCSDDTVYVHHYIDSIAHFSMDSDVSITQETNYPWDGRIILRVSGLSGRRLAVRIPGWCPDAKLILNGFKADYTMEFGYAVISVAGNDITLELDLEMPVTLIEASPMVREDAGRVCVQKGPIVYCAEAVDNGKALWALSVDTADLNPRMERSDELGLDKIIVNGWRRQSQDDTLYYPVNKTVFERLDIQLIPYFAFANRGESEMTVWLNKK